MHHTTQGLSQRGTSLIAMLVMCALVGIVAMVVSQEMIAWRAASENAARSQELDALRDYIVNTIDCEATTTGFAMAYPPPATCGSTSAPGGQVAPFLTLRRQLPNFETSMPMTAAGRIGRWTLRASCSATEKTLVVRAALVNPANGSFMRDPLTGKVADWNWKPGLLFGTGPGVRKLCMSDAPSVSMAVMVRRGAAGEFNNNESLESMLEDDGHDGECVDNICFENGCADITSGLTGEMQLFSAMAACRRWCGTRGFGGGTVTECNWGGAGAWDDFVHCVCASDR